MHNNLDLIQYTTPNSWFKYTATYNIDSKSPLYYQRIVDANPVWLVHNIHTLPIPHIFTRFLPWITISIIIISIILSVMLDFQTKTYKNISIFFKSFVTWFAIFLRLYRWEKNIYPNSKVWRLEKKHANYLQWKLEVKLSTYYTHYFAIEISSIIYYYSTILLFSFVK